MIRGAIFDMDGTILDSMQVWEHAGKRYLNGLGIEAEPGLNRILNDMSMSEGAAYLKRTYALPFTEAEIIDGVNRTILQAYAEEIPLKDGVFEFLKGFQKMGVPMAIATSSDRVLVEAALGRLRVLDCFQEILTCTEFGKGKKEPDIYLEAARRLCAGREAVRNAGRDTGQEAVREADRDADTEAGRDFQEEIWVYEDALFAAKTAKRAGFSVAAVYDELSRGDQKELRELADVFIKTGADWGHHLLSLSK